MGNANERNLQWARDRVCGYLHADVTEADEAFSGPAGEPYQIIDEALTDSYDELIAEAARQVDPDHFKFTMQAIWPSGQAVFTLPNNLDRTDVLYLRDVTSGLPGIVLKPGHAPEYGTPAGLFWSAPNQLTWSDQGNWAGALGTNAPTILIVGPFQTMTLSIGYQCGSIVFTEPTQEPTAVPFRFRQAWPYKAAATLDPAHVLAPKWTEFAERITESWHLAINQSGNAGSYSPESDVDALW